MSQERHEHRLDNPKEKIAVANDGMMNEVNGGREDLAKEHIQRQCDLKNGAASGITNEFGKPTIDFDDQKTPNSAKYTSRPILPGQCEPGSAVDNRGAAIPEQTVGHDNSGAVMTPIPWSIQDQRRRERQPQEDKMLNPETHMQAMYKHDYLVERGLLPNYQQLRRPDSWPQH